MARNYKGLFAICKKHGFNYKDKVAEFTAQTRAVPTESLKSLTDGEFKEFMLQMKRLNEPMRQTFTPKPGDKQRKMIIAIARDMRWDIKGKIIMMKRIDEFMLTRTKYKKKLNELTLDELNKVCYTFENDVKRSFLSGLNK